MIQFANKRHKKPIKLSNANLQLLKLIGDLGFVNINQIDMLWSICCHYPTSLTRSILREWCSFGGLVKKVPKSKRRIKKSISRTVYSLSKSGKEFLVQHHYWNPEALNSPSISFNSHNEQAIEVIVQGLYAAAFKSPTLGTSTHSLRTSNNQVTYFSAMHPQHLITLKVPGGADTTKHSKARPVALAAKDGQRPVAQGSRTVPAPSKKATALVLNTKQVQKLKHAIADTPDFNTALAKATIQLQSYLIDSALADSVNQLGLLNTGYISLLSMSIDSGTNRLSCLYPLYLGIRLAMYLPGLTNTVLLASLGKAQAVSGWGTKQFSSVQGIADTDRQAAGVNGTAMDCTAGSQDQEAPSSVLSGKAEGMHRSQGHKQGRQGDAYLSVGAGLAPLMLASWPLITFIQSMAGDAYGQQRAKRGPLIGLHGGTSYQADLQQDPGKQGPDTSDRQAHPEEPAQGKLAHYQFSPGRTENVLNGDVGNSPEKDGNGLKGADMEARGHSECSDDHVSQKQRGKLAQQLVHKVHNADQGIENRIHVDQFFGIRDQAALQLAKLTQERLNDHLNSQNSDQDSGQNSQSDSAIDDQAASEVQKAKESANEEENKGTRAPKHRFFLDPETRITGNSDPSYHPVATEGAPQRGTQGPQETPVQSKGSSLKSVDTTVFTRESSNSEVPADTTKGPLSGPSGANKVSQRGPYVPPYYRLTRGQQGPTYLGQAAKAGKSAFQQAQKQPVQTTKMKKAGPQGPLLMRISPEWSACPVKTIRLTRQQLQFLQDKLFPAPRNRQNGQLSQLSYELDDLGPIEIPLRLVESNSIADEEQASQGSTLRAFKLSNSLKGFGVLTADRKAIRQLLDNPPADYSNYQVLLLLRLANFNLIKLQRNLDSLQPANDASQSSESIGLKRFTKYTASALINNDHLIFNPAFDLDKFDCSSFNRQFSNEFAQHDLPFIADMMISFNRLHRRHELFIELDNRTESNDRQAEKARNYIEYALRHPKKEIEMIIAVTDGSLSSPRVPDYNNVGRKLGNIASRILQTYLVRDGHRVYLSDLYQQAANLTIKITGVSEAHLDVAEFLLGSNYSMDYAAAIHNLARFFNQHTDWRAEFIAGRNYRALLKDPQAFCRPLGMIKHHRINWQAKGLSHLLPPNEVNSQGIWGQLRFTYPGAGVQYTQPLIFGQEHSLDTIMWTYNLTYLAQQGSKHGYPIVLYPYREREVTAVTLDSYPGMRDWNQSYSFRQLLLVQPRWSANSNHQLQRELRWLMIQYDKQIINYYRHTPMFEHNGPAGRLSVLDGSPRPSLMLRTLAHQLSRDEFIKQLRISEVPLSLFLGMLSKWPQGMYSLPQIADLPYWPNKNEALLHRVPVEQPFSNSLYNPDSVVSDGRTHPNF